MDVSIICLSLVLIAIFSGISARPLLNCIGKEEATRAAGRRIRVYLARLSTKDSTGTSESSPSVTSFQPLSEKSGMNPILTTSCTPSEKTKIDSPPQINLTTTSPMYDAPKQTSPSQQLSQFVSKPQAILFFSVLTTKSQPLIQEGETSNITMLTSPLPSTLPATSASFNLEQKYPLISVTKSRNRETLASHPQTWYLLILSTPHSLSTNTIKFVSELHSESRQTNAEIVSKPTSEPFNEGIPEILSPTMWILPTTTFPTSENTNLTLLNSILSSSTIPHSTIQNLSLPNSTETPTMSRPTSLPPTSTALSSKSPPNSATTISPASKLPSSTEIPISSTSSLRHEATTLNNDELKTTNQTKTSPSILSSGLSLTTISFPSLSSKKTLESRLKKDPLNWFLMRAETRLEKGQLNWLFAKAAEKLQAWLLGSRAADLLPEGKLIYSENDDSNEFLESVVWPSLSYTPLSSVLSVSSVSPTTFTSTFPLAATLNNLVQTTNEKQNGLNSILSLVLNSSTKEQPQSDDALRKQSVRKKVLADSVGTLLENDNDTSGYSNISKKPIEDVALMKPKNQSRNESTDRHCMTTLTSSFLLDLSSQHVGTPRKQPLETKNTGNVVSPLLHNTSSTSSKLGNVSDYLGQAPRLPSHFKRPIEWPRLGISVTDPAEPTGMLGARTSVVYQLPSYEDEIKQLLQDSVESLASVVPSAADLPLLSGFQSLNRSQPNSSLSVNPRISSPALRPTNRMSVSTGFLFSLPSQRGSPRRMRSSRSTRASFFRSSQIDSPQLNSTPEHSGITTPGPSQLRRSLPRTTNPASTRLPASFGCEKKMPPAVTFLTRTRSTTRAACINKFLHRGALPMSLPSPPGGATTRSTLSVSATEATTMRPKNSSTSAVPTPSAPPSMYAASTADE